MNAQTLDIIRSCCDMVPMLWGMDELYRDVDEYAGDLAVVGQNTRWCDSIRSRIFNHVGDDNVRSTSQRRLVFINTRSVDFETSSNVDRFRGRHWARVYLQSFMVEAVNEPGAMPVYRIPSQPWWHELEDALEDAQEFLRDHQGEVEFDFQQRRYKVPYGCDYAVEIGGLLPDYMYGRGMSVPRLDFSGLQSWDSAESVATTYAGISRSPAPQIPEDTMRQLAQMEYQTQFNIVNGNQEGAAINRQRTEAIYEQARQQAAARFADLMMRPSPVFERLRGNNREAFTGGNEMRSPLQWSQPPNDPLEFPMPGRVMHLSEVGEYPIGPSGRELDLQRRLDTVRECITSMPNPLTFRDPVMAQRFMEAISPVPPVQYLDSYVYRYEFVNGQAIKVDDKLTGGTILDAAARPVRKFRVVEE